LQQPGGSKMNWLNVIRKQILKQNKLKQAQLAMAMK
jgi:hypothetical protein